MVSATDPFKTAFMTILTTDKKSVRWVQYQEAADWQDLDPGDLQDYVERGLQDIHQDFFFSDF
jgi:hypothetical protein